MTEHIAEDKLPGKATFLNKIRLLIANRNLQFMLGLFLIMIAIYMIIPYISYFFTAAADFSFIEAERAGEEGMESANWGGNSGAHIAHYLINETFGLSSLFIVLFVAVSGVKLMQTRPIKLRRWFFGCAMLLIWFSLFFGFFFYDLYKDTPIYWGGLHGRNVSVWLETKIGVGGVVLLFIFSAISILIYFNRKAIDCIRDLLSGKHFRAWKEKRKAKKEAQDLESQEEHALSHSLGLDSSLDAEDELVSAEPEVVVENFTPEEPLDLSEVETTEVADDEFSSTNEDLLQADEASCMNADLGEKDPAFDIEVKEDEMYEGSLDQPYNPKLDLPRFKFPTLDLMKEYENNEPSVNMEEQQMNKEKIISTLKSFGIDITTIKATVGPTVTLYEITPEQGVRISKIRNLEDDIALSLAALGIRIIAPIPGKGTIGIEVPNENPRIVSGQSIIGSKKFQECKYDLPIAFGKTITNEVFIVDLCKMPHVLVAGATGQGKSVGLNTMITSLLYKKHPAELKFVLIDPKKVEFSIYSTIKNHYLAQLPDAEEPIVTDVTKVVETLNSVCVEMDSRYDLLKTAKVRNIKEYNEKFISRRLNPDKGHRHMPYMVVVIDEFGDLIMTAGKEIELPIARIAQLARAVGIHMVIATQRPTTNIITGTIKANFPARVAFRVSSMMDSRTILDRPGANQLIGKGDMLFLQGSEPKRVQCAFIDTPEVENITKFISEQQGYPTPFELPEYTSDEAKAAMGDVDPTLLDPLFKEAARVVVLNQQGSTSSLQRQFSIGYNRAGRIMDQLERMGIVSAQDGSKPREVFCQTEMDLENILNNYN